MSNKNRSKKKDGINPLVAGVTGAIIGGVAAAAAITFSDEKKRQEVGDALSDAKDKTVGYVEDKKDEVEEKIYEGTEKVKKTADILKNSAERTVKDIKKI